MDWQSLQVPIENKWNVVKGVVAGGWGDIKKALSPTPISPRGELQVPSALPTPTPQPMEQSFQKGFKRYGSELANYSGNFAEAAEKYNLPDPYLPAVMALMETSGGKNLKYKNNPFNWGMQDMPSTDYTIDHIYSGIGGRFPYYQKYLQTKDIGDFFDSYTPQDGVNPSKEELVSRYNSLRKYFE